MEAARRGTGRGNNRVLVAYGAGSVALTGLFPWLPAAWQGASVIVVYAGAAACVLVGWHRVRGGWRWPWTLLAAAILSFVAANLVLRLAGPKWDDAGLLVDAVGNVLVLAAAVSVIVRRGARDLGGVVDAAVIALAAGSLLWSVLPHRLGTNAGMVAQANLFVVLFALTGVLGCLLRLLLTATPVRALWWVLVAITLAIAGNVVVAFGGGVTAASRRAEVTAAILFIMAFTATGLFGLDATGPRLVDPGEVTRPERLTTARLVFLGTAVAAVPVVVGVHDLVDGPTAGFVLAAQGALTAALVMVRIGLLSADRTRAEDALAYQATHDQLTGLANRRQFVARLRDELARDGQCAVLFCDLDGFKAINDRYGHEAGDRLLVQIAQRLRRGVPPPGEVSRFGGDEFAVLLVDTTTPAAQATRDRIARMLDQPYRQVHDAQVGVSIGLTAADGERDPERLLRAADRTMYREKAMRRRPSR